MIDEPSWLTKKIVMALHSESVKRFGGAAGIRDEGLLESALQRPLNLRLHGDEPSLHQLAAAYGAGIIRNHPCIDGNKRAGLLAIRAFLFCNAVAFEPSESEEVAMILSLAAGELEEAELATWIAQNAKPP